MKFLPLRMRAKQGGNLYHFTMVWPDRDANPRPTVQETLTTNPFRRGSFLYVFIFLFFVCFSIRIYLIPSLRITLRTHGINPLFTKHTRVVFINTHKGARNVITSVIPSSRTNVNYFNLTARTRQPFCYPSAHTSYLLLSQRAHVIPFVITAHIHFVIEADHTRHVYFSRIAYT